MNTDARSVVVSSPWSSLADDPSRPLEHLATLLGVDVEGVRASSGTIRPEALAEARDAIASASGPNPAAIVPLRELHGFSIAATGIVDPAGRHVAGWFAVALQGREVDRWCQPLLESHGEPEFVLASMETPEGLRVALRTARGPGWSGAELGPTVSSSPGTATSGVHGGVRRLSVRQSDEGGRFHHSIARYSVVVVDGAEAVQGSVVWLSLGEVEVLARGGGSLTNELRSCLSLLLAGA